MKTIYVFTSINHLGLLTNREFPEMESKILGSIKTITVRGNVLSFVSSFNRPATTNLKDPEFWERFGILIENKP